MPLWDVKVGIMYSHLCTSSPAVLVGRCKKSGHVQRAHCNYLLLKYTQTESCLNLRTDRHVNWDSLKCLKPVSVLFMKQNCYGFIDRFSVTWLCSKISNKYNLCENITCCLAVSAIMLFPWCKTQHISCHWTIPFFEGKNTLMRQFSNPCSLKK